MFLCQQYGLSSSCNTTYGATTYGNVLTQVLANADVSGYDGTVGVCPHVLKHQLTPPPALFWLDDMPRFRSELVQTSTNTCAEPHRLVREAQAKSASAAQATK